MSGQVDVRKGAVVITGASTGIGRACAHRMSRLGYLVFGGVREEADGLALQQASGGTIAPIRLDVTDEASVEAAARQVSDALGGRGIVGLVNNAGIAVAGPLEFLPVEALRRQFEVNVLGQIAVTRAFLPHLRAAGGRIVNVGSISGRVAFPLLGPYCASKWALEALTASLRMELAPWNIHVAIVEPGGIATPIWDKALAAGDMLAGEMPPVVERLYGPVIAGQRKRAMRSSQNGLSPNVVAHSVAHALTAPRPRTRYVMGRSAHMGEIMRHLPERLRERLILFAIHRQAGS